MGFKAEYSRQGLKEPRVIEGRTNPIGHLKYIPSPGLGKLFIAVEVFPREACIYLFFKGYVVKKTHTFPPVCRAEVIVRCQF